MYLPGSAQDRLEWVLFIGHPVMSYSCDWNFGSADPGILVPLVSDDTLTLIRDMAESHPSAHDFGFRSNLKRAFVSQRTQNHSHLLLISERISLFVFNTILNMRFIIFAYMALGLTLASPIAATTSSDSDGKEEEGMEKR
jgi:hypothetical protein